jgi:hypothetical protein
MLSKEILEIILIFSTTTTIILIIVLIYPYIKDKLKNNDNSSITQAILSLIHRSKDKLKTINNYNSITQPVLNLIHKIKDTNRNNISNLNKNQSLNNIKQLKNLNHKIYKKEEGNKNNNKSDNKKSAHNDLDNKKLVDKQLNNKLNNKNLSDNKLNDETIANNHPKDEKSDDNAYTFVVKSWEEPMSENHKDIMDNFSDVQKKSKEQNKPDNLNKLNTDKTQTIYYEKELNKEVFSLINNDSKLKNINNKSLEKNELSAEEKNHLKKQSPPQSQTKKTKPNISNNQAILDIPDKLSLGKQIIFYYNNESYLSEVLEIKHNNVKVLYRGKYRWIQTKDIKKIF